MFTRFFGLALCGFLFAVSGVPAQSPGREKSGKDDRAALQKSMNDFKRSVGGRSAGLSRPVLSGLQIRGGVSVPDGGEALLGGVANSSEGKNSFGAGPVQNRATGKTTTKTTTSVRVWLIIFEEEEERQTGYSPRKK